MNECLDGAECDPDRKSVIQGDRGTHALLPGEAAPKELASLSDAVRVL